MYNGNGNGNYNGGYNGNGGSVNVGGFRIKPLYLYIGVAVIAVVAVYFLINFVQAGLVMHFSLAAGVLLLLANLRELIGQSYSQRGSTAMLNCLIGSALVCAWLSQIVGLLLWIPALLLLGVSVPLVLGRASVYNSYVQTARSAVGSVRRAVGR
ncbi:MAG: hypothetical protein MUD01_26795 [Chloroflexaceae bacterium]|nr:hypothetical protein [Chloroflexaceae bacterium]